MISPFALMIAAVLGGHPVSTHDGQHCAPVRQTQTQLTAAGATQHIFLGGEEKVAAIRMVQSIKTNGKAEEHDGDDALMAQMDVMVSPMRNGGAVISIGHFSTYCAGVFIPPKMWAQIGPKLIGVAV